MPSTSIEAAMAGVAVGATTGAIALLLAYGGAMKVSDPVGLTKIFVGYGAIPKFAAGFLARTVPVAEIVVGLALVAPVTHRTGTIAAAVLFAAAAAVVGFSLGIGRVPTTCGCWGTDDHRPPTWRTVFRVMALFIATAALTLGPLSDFTLSQFYWAGVLMAISGTVLVAFVRFIAPIRPLISGRPRTTVTEIIGQSTAK